MNETLRELLAKQQAILLTHAAEHGQVRRIKKTYTIPGYGLLRRHFPNHVINRLFFQSSFKKFWMGDFEVRTDLPASAQLMFGPRRLATIALACGLDADMVQDVESKFSKQCIPGSPTLISLDSPDVLPQTKALLACWIEFHHLEIDLSWLYPGSEQDTLMSFVLEHALDLSARTRHDYYHKKALAADSRRRSTLVSRIKSWLHENEGEHSPREIAHALEVTHAESVNRALAQIVANPDNGIERVRYGCYRSTEPPFDAYAAIMSDATAEASCGAQLR